MTPPRIARAVVKWLAGPADREFLLNDLDEEFQAIAGTAGPRAASRWYWRQAATSLMPLIGSRFPRLDRPNRHHMTHPLYPRHHSFRMFGRDLILAVRTLAKARAYTFVSVASLGLGMGTVMAILLLVRAVFGTPPGVNPDGLVELVVRPTGPLFVENRGPIRDIWSYPDFLDVRDSVRGVTVSGWAFGESRLRLPGRGGAVPVATMYVSSNYFSTVGVTLAHGRGFEPSHEGLSAPPVVVVGHRLWQMQLGSDPGIVGRTITMNQVAHVVVGIAPERYQLHFSLDGAPDVQLWAPLHLHPRLEDAGTVRINREVDWLRVAGRLSPGTNVEQADAAVASIMAGLAQRYPSSNQYKAGGVEPYASVGARMRGEIRFVRAAFMGATGLVLLIVCLNVSGMMVVRSAMRQRELAIRLSIGATRARLMQYLLSEALVLSVLGGTLSATLLFGLPAVVFWWRGVWHPDLDLFLPDRWTFVQSVALCFVTSLVFGLLPAIRFSRPSIVSALKDDSTGSGRRVGRFHRWTAAIQAGIAVPFLVVGGVKLDQSRVTAQADLGFRPDGLFAAPLSPAPAGSAESDAALYRRRVQQRLAQAPGVTSVTFADGLPLDFDARRGWITTERDTTLVPTRTTRVGPGYLETMGIRLLRGRAIGRDDRERTERVVMISEPLATRLFPGREPIGERLTVSLQQDERQVFTVIGVTADLVGSQMGNPRPQLFMPLAQQPAPRVFAIARGSASDTSMRATFEGALTAIDPDYVLTTFVTGDGLRRESEADLLVHSIMGSGAATVALMLAALGVYGVIGFMVATRTREFGVRIALGASAWRVLGEVLTDSVKLAIPGVVGGLVLAMLWIRVADPAWYSLGVVEPLVYGAAAATAFLVALLAGVPSARRAAAVEPIQAMRAE